MFKSIQRNTGEEIISLAPEWRSRLNDLRALTARDLLVCQGCGQPVRLKAGPSRRPHFAHKHLAGCTYGSESPAVSEARGALYERLCELFPGAVKLEQRLPEGDLPRAVDLVVESGGQRFALWVVDNRVKMEARERILGAFQKAGLPVIWVLTAEMLHPDAKSPTFLRLSPSDRDFMRTTPYDEIGRESHLDGLNVGASLHYLDAKSGLLTSYRALERVHAPNIFSGRKVQHPLRQVMLDPLAPDFMHPGEGAGLRASRAERARRSDRIRRFLGPETPPPAAASPATASPAAERAEEIRRRWFSATPESSAPTPAPVESTGSPAPSGASARCVHCGQITEDWWQVWRSGTERLCKCRSCLEKGLA